jgi:hypothetical protein
VNKTIRLSNAAVGVRHETSTVRSTVCLPRILRQSTKHFKSKIVQRFFPCLNLIYDPRCVGFAPGLFVLRVRRAVLGAARGAGSERAAQTYLLRFDSIAGILSPVRKFLLSRI